jgi:hypothetical protein
LDLRLGYTFEQPFAIKVALNPNLDSFFAKQICYSLRADSSVDEARVVDWMQRLVVISE